MRPNRPPIRLFVFLLALTLGLPGLALVPGAVEGQEIASPESFFGFQMGADRQLARWDKLVEYYGMLGEQSDRLHVWNMGPTTLGNPFLALVFSSPENLARLDDLQQLNAMLSDPRGVSEAEIERAIANGKAVIVQSMCLHSTEVAAGQTAAELAYDMVTRSDEEMLRILDNTIGIMIPCFNPDGQIMVTDWVRRTVGTEYEGTGLPYLYHPYIGHDNNRDAFMQNTVESQYGAQIIFREWIPQAYVDHHQMGGYTARIYLPPYAEPVRPEGDPAVWREMSWYGAHMALKMEEEGLEGAVNAAIYSGWGHFGFHWITPFHNIAGMLTESASARLATPLYVHPEQLGGSRQLPEYEEQTTFPNPWAGGWWHVRDIVERQKVAYMATLDIAARNRETVLKNAYLKAKRQTERGADGSPVAFVIPAEQHDPLTMMHMVNRLLLQGIEVQRVSRDFTHEGRVYGEGTFIVSMAQPKRGVIRWLLGQTYYPDNSYTRDREGSPIRPYDMSTDNMAEFMGVRVDPVDTEVEAALTKVAGLLEPVGQVSAGAFGYLVDGRQNASFKAVNLLWDSGVSVRRADQDGDGLRSGDFIVPASASAAAIADVARRTGVDFQALDTDATGVSRPVNRLRVGMYQRYFGGNMDEGWTRWLLEDFAFPYDTLMDAEIKAGNLNRAYDVIILPADGVAGMTGEEGSGGGFRGGGASDFPPEYRSGFGQEGVDALEAFVENGGTLVTFAEAGDLPIEKFDLPVQNVVADLPSTEFWSPGSTLRVTVDNTNPLAYGMPEEALATFLARNQVYEITARRNERIVPIVKFVDRDLLESGWLLGEDRIANRAAMIEAEHGQGKIVLIGFRAQHRAQTHGTFKLVFNSLVSARVGPAEVAEGGVGPLISGLACPVDVDAVTFDFYQTLAYHRAGTGRGTALVEYLQEMGLDSDPWEHQVLYDVFAPHAVEYGPDQSDAAKRRYLRRLAERVFERLNVRAPTGAAVDHAENLWGLLGPASLAVFEEVHEVLRAIKAAGYPLAVVSNWQCGLGHFCTELGLGDAFDHVLASADVGFAKPDPRIFHQACQRLGAPPQRVLHVGDSIVDDYKGGLGAGLHVVLIQRSEDAATVEAPTIADLTELTTILDR